MPCLVGHLDRGEQRRLFEDLNYLNESEFRGFCRKHGIPFEIYIETPGGERRKTRDRDRKAVVLDRIRHYLRSGEILPATCFVEAVVSERAVPGRPRASDRLYYGWYQKTGPVADLLGRLTGGKYRDGAIARLLIREYWTAGEAPTLEEFAAAWVEAEEKGLGSHPEAAWLADRSRGEAGKNWKAKRVAIAKSVLEILDEIQPSSETEQDDFK